MGSTRSWFDRLQYRSVQAYMLLNIGPEPELRPCIHCRAPQPVYIVVFSNERLPQLKQWTKSLLRSYTKSSFDRHRCRSCGKRKGTIWSWGLLLHEVFALVGSSKRVQFVCSAPTRSLQKQLLTLSRTSKTQQVSSSGTAKSFPSASYLATKTEQESVWICVDHSYFLYTILVELQRRAYFVTFVGQQTPRRSQNSLRAPPVQYSSFTEYSILRSRLQEINSIELI